MLTAEKAFLCVSLFNEVQLYMTRCFPRAISQWSEMMVSIKRIQDFLLLEEREDDLSVVKEEEVERRRGGEEEEERRGGGWREGGQEKIMGREIFCLV